MVQNSLQSLPITRLAPYLPKVLNLLLLLLIAHSLAELTWAILTPEEQPSAQAPQRAQPRAPVTRPRHAEHVAGLHVFGTAPAETPQEDAISAPETKLNLTLRGVFATGGEDGLAIIAMGGGKEDIYGIGDALPGGARLKVVYPDRVILERGARLETLRLPKDKDLGIAFDEQPPGRGSARGTGDIGHTLQNYRAEVMKNPAKLASMVGYEPVKEGNNFVGFRLIPKGNQALFTRLGLQSGDVVTAVNGVALNNEKNGMRALRKLMNAKELNLTVRRGGQDITIQHPIGG